MGDNDLYKKSEKMGEYTPEEYEFAIRILHHRNKLSDEEVTEWMKAPEHLLLLEEMAIIRMETETIDVEKIAEKPKRILGRWKRNRKLRKIYSAAAVVALIIGAGLFWLWSSQLGPGIDATEQKIVPGMSKAQLILANGEVVTLHSTVKEIAGMESEWIHNDSVNGLKYRLNDVIEANLEEYNTLSVPIGGFYKLELSDGTKVWLNSKSELRFPICFGKQKREVYLKGEAHFEVMHDENRPFRVYLEKSIVTVLGTTFNISDYSDEENVYTTLVEGSVCFESDKSNEKVVLTSGSLCIMDKSSGKTLIEDVDTELYTAWVKGRFAFRFMDMESILRQLQRWYDFEIIWLNPEVKSYQFQGTARRDFPIETVFKAIELTTDVKFNIIGKQVVIEKKQNL